MIFFILFIGNFLTPTFCLIQCFTGANCSIQLKFNQIVPDEKTLLETCSMYNQRKSCSVYVEIDYENQQVKVIFDPLSRLKNYSDSYIDLLAINPKTAKIRRYNVKVQMHNNNNSRKVELDVFIQCQHEDKCEVNQLRHFWYRLVQLDGRRKNFMDFYQLLYSNTSNVTSCFDDKINKIKECDTNKNLCWASNDTERKCQQMDENHFYDFIYAYNRVDRPGILTNENVTYDLACHVNNCNNNETIKQVRKKKHNFFKKK